ncbi:hypothetical protein [Aliarcobacter cryaerophilus]|uniref:hypothetical protein n=1 Tax=Aliarcobacter cryaerophilus TaxID=28198 RepID=UPI000824776D|nr:hypothetical protein [Aliarcobacter cryaerophilus]
MKFNKLTKSIIALNHILVAELKRNKIDRVEENLEKLDASIQKIFSLNNKEEFENLMLNQNSRNQNSHLWKQTDYSIPFNKIMELYSNIYIEVVKDKRLYQSSKIRKHIHTLLKLITPYNNKKDFIEYKYFQNSFFIYHRKIFDESLFVKSSFSMVLGFQWYTNIIFNYIDKKSNFDLKYLNLYDSKLFLYIKMIILNNDFELFKNLIDWFHHGIGFHGNNIYSNIRRFVGYVNNEINHSKLLELYKDYELINNQKSLKEWLYKFEEIKNIVLKSEAKEEEANEIIKSAYQKFFFYNLKTIIHSIGAYLVYKEKFTWIKYMWSFKQPNDSSTIWIGHSIFPTSNDLINNYEYYNREDFTEGHSDSEFYYKIYEIFLLSNFNDGKLNFSFLNKNELHVSSIKYYSKEMLEYINKLDDKYLEELGIKHVNIQNLSEEFFSVIEKVDLESKNFLIQTDLLESKKNEFRKNFLTEYENKFGLMSIVEKYTDTLKLIYKKTENKFGINTLLPKDIFVSEMVGGIDTLAATFANSLINGENRIALESIIKNATVSEKNTLDEILSNLDIENLFLICVGYPEFLYNEKNFIRSLKREDAIDINSFEGWYKFENKEIPLFIIDSNDSEEFILILDKNKFIEIEQYKLLEEDILINPISEDVEKLILEKELKENRQKRKEDLKLEIHLEMYESIKIKTEYFFGILYKI